MNPWTSSPSPLRAEASLPKIPSRVHAGDRLVKILRPGEAVAAAGQRRGRRAGIEEHGVVAGLRIAEGEDLALRGFLEDEVQRGVTAGGQDLRDAGPDQMHVDGQRGGRGRRRQPPLQLRGRFASPSPSPPSDAGTKIFR